MPAPEFRLADAAWRAIAPVGLVWLGVAPLRSTIVNRRRLVIAVNDLDKRHGLKFPAMTTGTERVREHRRRKRRGLIKLAVEINSAKIEKLGVLGYQWPRQASSPNPSLAFVDPPPPISGTPAMWEQYLATLRSDPARTSDDGLIQWGEKMLHEAKRRSN